MAAGRTAQRVHGVRVLAVFQQTPERRQLLLLQMLHQVPRYYYHVHRSCVW